MMAGAAIVGGPNWGQRGLVSMRPWSEGGATWSTLTACCQLQNLIYLLFLAPGACLSWLRGGRIPGHPCSACIVNWVGWWLHCRFVSFFWGAHWIVRYLCRGSPQAPLCTAGEF